MAGVTVGRFHLFFGGVSAAVGALFVLLLFGQMAVATELGDLRRGGNLIGRDVADGSAVLLAGAVADAAIHVVFGVFVGLEVGHGFGVAGGTAVLLRKDGQGREQEEH
jgi:hypothetical protein